MNNVIDSHVNLSINFNSQKISPIAALGGSSQSTQSAVIQQTAPWAALAAGQVEANAATKASDLFTTQSQNAINEINSQYVNITNALAPQTEEGIQALDTLNQYLQLSPYRPLTAPVAPKAPTTAALDVQAASYIRDNGYTDPQTGKLYYAGPGALATPGGANGSGSSGTIANGFATGQNGAVSGANNSPANPYTTNTSSMFPMAPGMNGNPAALSTAEINAYNATGQGGVTPGQQPGIFSTNGLGVALLAGAANGGPNAYQNQPIVNGQTPPAGAFQPIDTSVTNAMTDMGVNTLQNTYDVNKQVYDQQKALYDYANTEADKTSTPFTAQDISNKITNLPGYQSQLSQGISAIDADAASKGYLGSGAMLKELGNFGQNTLSQFYGNTLNQLAGLAAMGNSAATQQVSAAQNAGNSIAGLYSGIGQAQGNSALAAGNAIGQSLIAANQEFSTMQTGSSSSSSGADLGGIGSLIGALGSL